MSIDHTLSPTDLAERLGTNSLAWIKQGVRDGRFPCLHVPTSNGQTTMRFTEAHLEQIAATLEQPAGEPDEQPKPVPTAAPANVDVFGATARSASRHRKPNSSRGGRR